MRFQTIRDDSRCVVQAIPPEERAESIQMMVQRGLTKSPKALPPILFYDKRGSELFEEICQLPEYYLTRTEQAILDQNAAEMVAYCDRRHFLVELGSGSAKKTRTLLDSLFAAGKRPIYQPIDISRAMLQTTAGKLVREYPKLEVQAIASDYTSGLKEVTAQKEYQKVLLFLGSNLGNFSRTGAAAFLEKVRGAMMPNDLLFLGVDLVKELGILLSAYDDDRGTTAAFNRNILNRINSELDADFDTDKFHHQVVWNEIEQAIEMHLRSAGEQTVTIKSLDLTVRFKDGETIHTESSHKYTFNTLQDLCNEAGLALKKSWLDDHDWFTMNLIVPRPDGQV